MPELRATTGTSTVPRRAADVVEDAEFLVSTGECWTQAIRRLGYTRAKSLERVLYRAGHGGLVNALKANELTNAQRDMHRDPRSLPA